MQSREMRINAFINKWWFWEAEQAVSSEIKVEFNVKEINPKEGSKETGST